GIGRRPRSTPPPSPRQQQNQAQQQSGSKRRRRRLTSASRQTSLRFRVESSVAELLRDFLRSLPAPAPPACGNNDTSFGADFSSGAADQSAPGDNRAPAFIESSFLTKTPGADSASDGAAGWRLVSADPSGVPADRLPLPRLLGGESRLLNSRRLRHLVRRLPPRAEGADLRLLYRASRHGFSLQSAYRACHSGADPDAYCLLLVADTRNHLFGASLSAPPRMSEHYYGTGETFVFRWSHPIGQAATAAKDVKNDPGVDMVTAAAADSASKTATSEDSDLDEDEEDDVHNPLTNDFYHYAWTGENSFFERGATDSFNVGSRALWLDSGLYRGRTQACDTFASPVLTGAAEDFVVQELELWLFTCDPLEPCVGTVVYASLYDYREEGHLSCSSNSPQLLPLHSPWPKAETSSFAAQPASRTAAEVLRLLRAHRYLAPVDGRQFQFNCLRLLPGCFGLGLGMVHQLLLSAWAGSFCAPGLL
uniref:Oxidation resistance protein 1 n=1 Tax=Macrostomum lignano TaxID=282301 RepID=A0A1I8JNF0_9PLAT